MLLFESHIFTKASASRALNFWMSRLFRSGVWIKAEDTMQLNAALRHFLRAYSRLGFLSHQFKEIRFGTNPKLHMLWHIWRAMVDQATVSPHVENPMVHNTASDEDFIGKFCELTRCTDPRTRVARSLERYLTQVLLLWMHPNRRG